MLYFANHKDNLFSKKTKNQKTLKVKMICNIFNAEKCENRQYENGLHRHLNSKKAKTLEVKIGDKNFVIPKTPKIKRNPQIKERSHDGFQKSCEKTRREDGSHHF